MDVGAYSIAHANQSLAHKVSLSVAKMSMDMAKTQSADMTKILESAGNAIKSPVDTSGMNIDISV